MKIRWLEGLLLYTNINTDVVDALKYDRSHLITKKHSKKSKGLRVKPN